MDLKEFFRRDQFAASCGIELLEVSPGGSKVSMKVEERHLNGLRTVHGGAIFTLADFAFAVACNSHGTVAVALNVNISFVKAAFPGMTLYRRGEGSLGEPEDRHLRHPGHEREGRADRHFPGPGLPQEREDSKNSCRLPHYGHLWQAGALAREA